MKRGLHRVTDAVNRAVDEIGDHVSKLLQAKLELILADLDAIPGR